VSAHALASIALAVGGAFLCHELLRVDPMLSWLAAVNVVTLLLYGYDKAIAGSRMRRVPERSLLLVALVGGSVGALVGMHVFRHKTSKASFRWRFWGIVGVQAAIVAAYVHYIHS
jgi:uncharacterized membrane protein YsdA (DUF1294 family)